MCQMFTRLQQIAMNILSMMLAMPVYQLLAEQILLHEALPPLGGIPHQSPEHMCQSNYRLPVDIYGEQQHMLMLGRS